MKPANFGFGKRKILQLIFFYYLLQFSNYSSVEGVLYCKPHYDQILKSTGSLEKSFEGTEEKTKSTGLDALIIASVFTSKLLLVS